jgi:hypothetical protein
LLIAKCCASGYNWAQLMDSQSSPTSTRGRLEILYMAENNQERRLVAIRIGVIVAAIVILYVVPMAAGFQYRLLPLALWEFGKQPLSISAERVNGHMVTVHSGEMIVCGFFELVKPGPKPG